MNFKEFYETLDEDRDVNIALTTCDIDTGNKEFVGILPVSSIPNCWEHYNDYKVHKTDFKNNQISVVIVGGHLLYLSTFLKKCSPNVIVLITNITITNEHVYKGRAGSYSNKDYRVVNFSTDFSVERGGCFLRVFVRELI